MNRALYYALQWSWGLVQNLAGFLCWLAVSAGGASVRRYRCRGAVVTEWPRYDSMAIGMFIFFGHWREEDRDRVLAHEFGHTIQSIILGPLYLPVIGLPSLLWAAVPAFSKLRRRKKLSYYSFYTEKWADRCGGVRKLSPRSE